MIRHIRAAAVTVACAMAVAAAPAMAAGAMPAAVAGAQFKAAAEPQSTTEMLHLAQRRGGFRGAPRVRRGYRYRGRPYYGRRYYGRGGRWVGPAVGAGIAAIIIGGAIAASKERYRDRWEMCDERFRTFRWSDGTYIPYAGSPRVLCPYLRN